MVQIQRPSHLNLEALETVARPQAGIQRFYYYETVHAPILDSNHSVREPSQLEPFTGRQGRPVYRWDAKTFKKYDAIGSMYQLSKLPKEAKPIVIIENIADIPDGDRNIYDDPALVENILLHSWKDDTIHLHHHKNGPFQMSKCDYTVIFPVKPGDLQKLRHSVKSDDFGFVQF